MRNTLLKANLIALALFTGAVSCDVVEKDATPSASQQIDMFVAPNKSAVIDIQRFFPDYDKTFVSGTNSSVSHFSDRYIGYKLNGTESQTFGFSVQSKSGTKVSANVRVNSQAQNSGCPEAFTYAKISNKSKLVVNLFNNPEFCGHDVSATGFGISVAVARPGVDVAQNTEGTLFALCGCGEEGNTAIFSYDPPAGFVGQVKLRYYLGVFNSATHKIVGDDFYNPDLFEYYSAHDLVIDVTN